MVFVADCLWDRLIMRQFVISKAPPSVGCPAGCLAGLLAGCWLAVGWLLAACWLPGCVLAAWLPAWTP